MKPINWEKVHSFRNEEIDCEYTDEIVCPYCGCEEIDSWEYNTGCEDIGEIECGDCGKTFYATRQIDITYSTETKEEHEYWRNRLYDRSDE